MNYLMFNDGQKEYVFDDSLPASDTVLWSSIKWNSIGGRYYLSSPLTNNVLTAVTGNVIKFPFSGIILIMARGITQNQRNVIYKLNGTDNSIGLSRDSWQADSLYSFTNVNIGDQMSFTCNQTSNITIDILQI